MVITIFTVFENHPKSRILRFHFKWPKFIKNAKSDQFGMFWQTEATCLTVLPDRPHLIEQKLIESAKIRNSNEAFFGDF